MSDCIGAPANLWLERYVEGTLPEAEVEKFEEHYFDCPVCLAQVEALQAAREQLKRNPVAFTPPRRVLNWPQFTVGFGALAAALIVGVITLRMVQLRTGPAQTNAVVQPGSPPASPQAAGGEPATQLAQLADLRLPAYQAPTLRGAGAPSEFEQAMKLYNAGNCAGAIKRLSQVDAQSPDALAARFYTGLCQMHAGDLADSSKVLHQVAAAPDSPQQEAAWYYLAQIALAKSDAALARKDLARVVSLHGDLEHRARAELAQLPQDSGRQ